MSNFNFNLQIRPRLESGHLVDVWLSSSSFIFSSTGQVLDRGRRIINSFRSHPNTCTTLWFHCNKIQTEDKDPQRTFCAKLQIFLILNQQMGLFQLSGWKQTPVTQQSKVHTRRSWSRGGSLVWLINFLLSVYKKTILKLPLERTNRGF